MSKRYPFLRLILGTSLEPAIKINGDPVEAQSPLQGFSFFLSLCLFVNKGQH